MTRDDIKKLIKEAFTDNVYGKYPYSHREGDEEQATPDYEEEWKSFSDQLINNPKRDEVIELAKILVKDKDILADCLEIMGSNKSLGSALMKKVGFGEKVTDSLKDIA
jgi:hypothetical protein|tara:strand:- start:1664 stop:1987 length:324 start_codon:yes stop_codon:yes gene_type:complete